MIVCLCTGTPDRVVHRALDAGASSIADLHALGIGTGCGSCHSMLRNMMFARSIAAASLCVDEPSMFRLATAPAECASPAA
ncbi:MAG TPA: (2Fe-2S)-binding protein [Thermoanaerobaculia bacterium]|nr:(2Fe-2S)-binding protein [Thermoanaerobaculia bacterium]